MVILGSQFRIPWKAMLEIGVRKGGWHSIGYGAKNIYRSCYRDRIFELSSLLAKISTQ
jgi:hypothetical protein